MSICTLFCTVLYNALQRAMNLRDKKINELLLDNRFVDWVMNPDSTYREYWEQWINQHADHAAIATEARLLVLELKDAQQQADKETAWDESITTNMWAQIATATQQQSEPLRRRSHAWLYGLAAAAVLTGIVIAARLNAPHNQQLAKTTGNKNTQIPERIVRYNNSNKEQVFYLPDGSNMTLAQGARVSYPTLLNGAKREVALTGEAFFNVAHNAAKPFYIYTPNIVVKVLGTSFSVATGTAQERVTVKTGKVSVFTKEQDLEQTAPRILVAHQACVYSVPGKQLTMSLPGKPSKVEQAATHTPTYAFDEVPIAKVLNTLEHMYAIPVRYDSVALKNCFLTTVLGNESLENKLQVITKTIGASYTLGNNDIAIIGGGCK